MDSSKIIGLLAASVALTALILKIKKQKRKQKLQRKCWVNPYLSQRSEKGRYWSDVSVYRVGNECDRANL